MADKMIYSPEFPDGKEESFTAEEKAKRATRAIEVEAEIKANHEKAEKQIADKVSGNQKLKDLGLTDDEIAALIG
tara:strand:+ start:133 stop:357 length:225 start_codon:yes stop_codon:yes gene_type:complete